MIYFIRNEETNKIKIGYSKDPEERLRTLQTGSSGKLTLLLAIEGTQQDETAWHDRFADARIQNEWFDPVPELFLVILEIKDTQLEDRGRLLFEIASQLGRSMMAASMVGQGLLSNPDELGQEKERCDILQGCVETISFLLEGQ